MTFDRLIYIDRLKEAGVDDAVARAHADALREALLETVATKSDLNDVQNSLQHEIKEVQNSLDRKIDALDRKIDITARDLTIRGAGGLVIIASIIIGLKVFG